MSYTPLNLTDGTKVTSTHTTHIEAGITDCEDQISELKDSLSEVSTGYRVIIDQPDSFPDGISVNSTWNARAYKHGNMVFLRFNINLIVDQTTSSKTIFTLPDGFAPAGLTVTHSYCTQTGTPMLLSIDTSGNVSISSSVENCTSWGLRQCIAYSIVNSSM